MESALTTSSTIFTGDGGGGTFQDLPHKTADTEKQSLLFFKDSKNKGLSRFGAVIALACFIATEAYGIWVLAEISPNTEVCPVEIIVIAQVFTVVVVPAVIYFVIDPAQNKSWDLWCVRCVMMLFWSLFIASAAVISDEVVDACAAGMNLSVIAFMVVDAVIGSWATFGWLTADWT